MATRVFDCAVQLERERGIEAAATALTAGRLVVVPTDTVYGLAADAFNRVAVTDLLEAKGRAGAAPPPVLVADQSAVDGLAVDVSEAARALTDAFWPGGLTVLVTAQPMLGWSGASGAGTVALRMPLHPLALELLARTGPLAVSGANVAGAEPPVTADEAREMLGEAVAVYLDAGACLDEPQSTIVDATGERVRILRAGAVSAEDLADVLGDLLEPSAEAEAQP